jgi:hypothetical protein
MSDNIVELTHGTFPLRIVAVVPARTRRTNERDDCEVENQRKEHICFSRSMF